MSGKVKSVKKYSKPRDAWYFLKTRRTRAGHETYLQLIKRTSAYFLFAFLTLVLTFLVFYRSKGYFIEDGKIIGRGIILVDSAPGSGQIFIDSQKVGKTDKKVELDEGKHTLEIKKEGYLSWSREFNIRAEEVRWFYYPNLIPKNLETEDLLEFEDDGKMEFSKLNDENQVLSIKWGKTSADVLGFETVSFNIFDLSRYNKNKESLENQLDIEQDIVFPSQIFSVSDDKAAEDYQFSDWSPNADGILVWHSYVEGGLSRTELVLLNMDDPLKSVNLSRSNLQFDLGLSDIGVVEALSRVRFDEDNSLLILSGGEVADYNPNSLTKDRILIAGGVSSFRLFEGGYLMFSARADFKSSVTEGSLVPGVGAVNEAVYVQRGAVSPNEASKVLDLGVTNLRDDGSVRSSAEIFDVIDYSYTVNRRNGFIVIADKVNNKVAIYKNVISAFEKSGEPNFIPEPIEQYSFEDGADVKLMHNRPGISTQPGSYFFVRPNNTELFVYNFETEAYYRYEMRYPPEEKSTSITDLEEAIDEFDDNKSIPDNQKLLDIVEVRWLDAERLEVIDELGDLYYVDYDGNYLNLIIASHHEPKKSYFLGGKDSSIVLSGTNGHSGFNVLNFGL